jgi:hypothetical protein
MINGFQAMVGLWVWGLVVALHAAYRAITRNETDAIRESGPVGRS